MGRIEALYELGEREDAFLELEDELVEVGVGNAQARAPLTTQLSCFLRCRGVSLSGGNGGVSQVHAAMAAMLHTQRPQQELRAESEWEKAVELAPRFSDPVRRSKSQLLPGACLPLAAEPGGCSSLTGACLVPLPGRCRRAAQDWVKRTHHWPPSMLRALVSFLALS